MRRQTSSSPLPRTSPRLLASEKRGIFRVPIRRPPFQSVARSQAMPLLSPAMPPLPLLFSSSTCRRARLTLRHGVHGVAARSLSSSSVSSEAAAFEAEQLRLDVTTRARMESTAAAAEADGGAAPRRICALCCTCTASSGCSTRPKTAPLPS